METSTKKNDGTNIHWNEGESHINRVDFELLIPHEDIDTELKWTFSFHIYFFAVTFFILTFYTLASIINIRSQISRKRFISGINTFLCLFNVSRAISLLADPYGVHKNLPSSIMNALWAIGYPSLMSSFCLLQLAFLHLTKLKYGAKILRTEIFLRSMITLHIFSSVLRAVISSIHWSVNMVVINYIFELVFLSWALFIYTSFLYIGYQVFGLLKRVPVTMLRPDACQNKVFYSLCESSNASCIMQLVMLAPASNLVTSVTAALMPTLLNPATNMTSNQTATNKSSVKSNIAPPSTCASSAVGKSISAKDATSASCSTGKEIEKLSSTRLKNANDLKPEFSNVKRDSPLNRMKKLTWQSSLTNDSRTESSLTETKITPTPVAVSKRPILKDVNKISEISNAKHIESSKLPAENLAAEDLNDTEGKENDLLLHTILNHIAYVNRGATDGGFAHCGHDTTPTSRKKQLGFVLKITYSTAILGFCLTLAEFFQRFGPYGLMRYVLNDEEIRPWPWLAFQTFCRACELFMSGAIANITKQSPATVHRYYKHSPAMMKQRGSMFM